MTERCKWATVTTEPWTRSCRCQCVVVECRNPERVGDGYKQKTDGARFHTIHLDGDDFNRVRSFYCDRKTCFDFVGGEKHD